MCDDCRKATLDVHSGVVMVDVSGWGTWNIWVDIEPEEGFRSVLLGSGDALKLAWSLVVAAVRLSRRQRRQAREISRPAVSSGAVSPNA